MIYKAKKITHKISLEESALEKNFKIINKFLAPPNTGLGISVWSFGTGIDHLILGYSLQKVGKKGKGFLFHSRIRFNYSVGLGLGFNRSKAFCKQVDARSAGGRQDPFTYSAFEAIHIRDGVGIFLKSTGGVDFVSKKGKRKICLNLFYNQGVKQMVHYNIHYQYCFWNDPSRQIDVPNQILRNKGTTFGFSAGFPITLKK